MRTTQNLDLKLLDPTDSLIWETGVNENFQKLDRAAGEAAEAVKPNRLVFGPYDANPSSCDYICPSTNVGAYITGVVEGLQRDGEKTLVKSLGTVTLSVIDNQTAGCEFTTGVIQALNVDYLGLMAIDEATGNLLGYVVSYGDGRVLLDRRIIGTYSIGLYRAAEITLEFLPGTYNLGTPHEYSWSRWYPITGNEATPNRGTTGSAAYIANNQASIPFYKQGTPASITGRNVLLSLCGSVNILGNNAKFICNKSTQSGSLSVLAVDPAILLCLGGTKNVIKGLYFNQVNSGSYSGTGAIVTHISIIGKTLSTIQDITVDYGIPHSGLAVVNCRGCSIRDIKLLRSNSKFDVSYNVACSFYNIDMSNPVTTSGGGVEDIFYGRGCMSCSFIDITGPEMATSIHRSYFHDCHNLLLYNLSVNCKFKDSAHITITGIYGKLELDGTSCVSYTGVTSTVTVSGTCSNTNTTGWNNPLNRARVLARLIGLDEETGVGTFGLYPTPSELNLNSSYANGTAHNYGITNIFGTAIVPSSAITIPSMNRVIDIAGLSGYELTVGSFYYIGATGI